MNMQFIPSLSQETYAPRFTDFSVDLDSLQVNTEMLCTVNDSGNVVTADGDQFKLTQEQADAINTYLEDFSELMFEKSIEYAY